MINVLIVDDSPTMRMLIRATLENDSDIRVVGEAMDGQQAIQLAHELAPDLITIKALEIGALAVIRKPKNQSEADRLVQDVKTLAQIKVVRRPTTPKPKPAETLPGSGRKAKIIVMGASTGGPPALQRILKSMNPNLNIPIAIVQHISPGFIHGLARWLTETTPWQVIVAENRQEISPKCVYLAPDNAHLSFKKTGQLQLDTAPPIGGHRPSATVLFQSAAQIYRHQAIGVLLTGMGSDGAEGLKTLRDSGSYTIAQDEASCVIFGMPKQAIAISAAHKIWAFQEIGPNINRLLAANPKASA